MPEGTAPKERHVAGRNRGSGTGAHRRGARRFGLSLTKRERETLSLSAGCAAARMSGRRVTPPSSPLEATCRRPEFHGI